MPHDKNGQLIEPGDAVRVTVYEDNKQVDKIGVVRTVAPGTDTCNVFVDVPVRSVTLSGQYANAKDIEVVAKA
jgi:hypothetical protein